jgi:hypothetical protein
LRLLVLLLVATGTRIADTVPTTVDGSTVVAATVAASSACYVRGVLRRVETVLVLILIRS